MPEEVWEMIHVEEHKTASLHYPPIMGSSFALCQETEFFSVVHIKLFLPV
jgi:hypothetical protein